MSFLNFDEIPARTVLPGFRGQFIHTDAMTLTRWQIEAGAELPQHHHIHEQVTRMIEGEFEMTIEGETRRLTPGDVAVIPPHAVHSGQAISDCKILDIFQPVREDYIQPGDAIVRRSGFTLLEMLIVIAIIGVLVGLLLPAVQSAREAARRISCGNNAKQVVLAVHQYHQAFDELPRHGTGTFNVANDPIATNQYRLSFLVSLLPFIEQTPVWETIAAEPGDPMTARWPSDRGWYDTFLDADPSASAGDAGIGQPPRGRLSADNTTNDWGPPDDAATVVCMGPTPSQAAFAPWVHEVPAYRCPSDPGTGRPSLGRTNYAACLGDGIDALDEGWWRYDGNAWVDDAADRVKVSGRGAFIPRRPTAMRDIADGLSSTVVMGEICSGLGDGDIRTTPSLNNGFAGGVLDDPGICFSQNQIDATRPQYWLSAVLPANPSQRRGFRYADAMPLMTGFNTIRPPNAELCLGGGSDTIGTLTASSRHPGGCNVGFADGAVRFVTDSIDCGDPIIPATIYLTPDRQAGRESIASPTPSPFGVWGAMGTRASLEMIADPY